MKRMYRIAAAAGLTAIAATAVRAQEAPRAQAASLIAQGRLDAARSVYDSLLSVEPNDLHARVGRGQVLSWLGHDAEAADEFSAVLSRDATNISALLGLAYNHAWHGRYNEAEQTFERAIAIDSSSVDATKGQAYVALWRGDYVDAIARFERLAAARPEDAAVAVALGQAQLAAGHPRSARKAFRHALDIAPGQADAQRGLEAVSFTPSTIELSLWGGFTAFGGTSSAPGASDSRIGLRVARLAVRPAPAITLWAMVDDGLSNDNRGLATAGEHIPSYTGGALLVWAGRFITKVEAGYRELGTVGQRMYSAEQVVMLPAPVSLKLGGWVGRRDDDQTEWVVHAGAGVALSPRFTLESLVFLSENGLPGGDGKRVLVSGNYRFPNGWEFVGGAAYGRTGIALSETANVGEGFVTLSVPIAQVHRVHLSFRHQRVADAGNITVAALGVSLGLLGR